LSFFHFFVKPNGFLQKMNFVCKMPKGHEEDSLSSRGSAVLKANASDVNVVLPAELEEYKESDYKNTSFLHYPGWR